MSSVPPAFLQPRDIASFATNIIVFQGQPVGTCIKFRHFEGTDSLLHVQPKETARLLAGLQQYIENGRHDSLMMKFHQNAELSDGLSAVHPYNTLLSMTPKLSGEEAGTVRKATSVTESTFIDRHSFFVYRVIFADGGNAEFNLHECVAFNLWGYITKMEQDNEMLRGQVGGTA